MYLKWCNLLKAFLDAKEKVKDIEKLFRWEHDKEKKEFKLFVNTSRFEYLVKNGLEVPIRNNIFEVIFCLECSLQLFISFEQKVADGFKKNISYKDFVSATTPLDFDYSHKQPPQIKIPMFEYQLNALAWMKRVETEIAKVGWKISNKLSWEAVGSSILFDMTWRRFLIDAKETNVEILPKGGIYADGK